jgi:hypothetical protein
MDAEPLATTPPNVSPGTPRRVARGVAWYLAAAAITAIVVWAVFSTMWFHAFGGSKVEAGMTDRSGANGFQEALGYVSLFAPLLAAIAAFAVGTRIRDAMAVVASVIGALTVLAVALYGLACVSGGWDSFAVDHVASLAEFGAWLTATDPYVRWPFRADPVAYLLGGTILAALGATIGVWVGRGWRALRQRA